MSDELENAPDTPENFTKLREAHNESKRRVKELEARLEVAEPVYRETILRKAGVDPEAPLAQAVLKLHGDGEFTPEAIRATADTYGIVLGDGEGETADEVSLTPEQQQAIASAQRGEQLAAVGAPANPKSAKERYAEAEAAGDVKGMLAAQAEIAAAWEASR